jgi:NAD(P)-dependent dehydrogenase (short-subunit alcohol dehydrogenase family)
MNTMRTAVITGASRGIGACTAEQLKRQGFRVLCPTRNELDLASNESIEHFVTTHKTEHVDILVNNAGINILNSVEQINPADWQTMFQVNLNAPFRLIQAFAPCMKAAKWGRIVNVSSIWSMITREKRGAYSAMKAGLNGLTRTAAVELGPNGILVNAVCPGYVATDLTRQNNSPADLAQIAATIPLRRLAEPEEIASLVGFLCSEQNSYITGQTLIIDGGFTCV